MKRLPKVRIKRTPTRLFLSLYACYALLLFAIVAVFASCNVTRTVSTQSQYFTKGDTTCTIVTKTVETYDATKK